MACKAIENRINLPGGKVSFLSTNPKDIEAAANLIYDAFTTREPMTRHLMATNAKVLGPSMRKFSKELSEDMARGGLTPILKAPDGRIASIVMTMPYAPSPPPSEAPEGLAPIFDVLDKLGKQFASYLSEQKVPPKCIELLMAATHKDFQGLHAMDALTYLPAIKAKMQGFTHIMCKATSNSQTAAAAYGFESIGEVRYADHEHDKKKYFDRIGKKGPEDRDPAQAKVMLISIDQFEKNSKKAASRAQKAAAESSKGARKPHL